MSLSLYIQRCEDPSARRAWRASGLVELDTLRNGQRFECISGSIWVRNRKDHLGVIHCTSADGGETSDVFCQSALVRPINREENLT